MYIKSIKLNNFRNHKEKEIEFSPLLNIITGQNGVGKTNIVEAIYFFTIGKSIKTINNKELIKWGEEYVYFSLIYNKKNNENKIEISFNKNNEKNIIINNNEIKKTYELISNFNSIYFSPNELKIIKEGPSERRRFIDICISQKDKLYIENLIIYNKILIQRNKILKENILKDEKIELLKAWDNQLIPLLVNIYKKRKDFIEYLNRNINFFHNYITDNKETITIEYETFIKEETNDIEGYIKNELINAVEKDIEYKYSTIGIHKDDFKILSNNIDLRKFGSQGQQRTATLSLKLTELKYIEDTINEKPVIILDDVLSELDEQRKDKLIKIIDGYQTIITATTNELKINNKEIKIK